MVANCAGECLAGLLGPCRSCRITRVEGAIFSAAVSGTLRAFMRCRSKPLESLSPLLTPGVVVLLLYCGLVQVVAGPTAVWIPEPRIKKKNPKKSCEQGGGAGWAFIAGRVV